jgi:hypothetical protein
MKITGRHQHGSLAGLRPCTARCSGNWQSGNELACAGDITKLWPALSGKGAEQVQRGVQGCRYRRRAPAFVLPGQLLDAGPAREMGCAGLEHGAERRSPRIPPAPARPRSPSPAPATPPPRLLPGRGVDPGDEELEPRHRGARSAERGVVASWPSYSCHPCATQSGWTSQVTPVIAKVPVMVGEMGESDCGGS